MRTSKLAEQMSSQKYGKSYFADPNDGEVLWQPKEEAVRIEKMMIDLEKVRTEQKTPKNNVLRSWARYQIGKPGCSNFL